MYTLTAYDENGALAFEREMADGDLNAQLAFERLVRTAKRNGYFAIILRNEFAVIRDFAR